MTFALPRWLIIPLFALGLVIGARDAGAIEALDRQVVVEGDIVKLGDLFAGVSGHKAETAVARSPAPGREVTVSPSWLIKVARAQGLDEALIAGIQPLTVRRRGARIEGRQVSDLVAGTLAHETGLSDIDIRLDGGSGAIVVAGTDDPALRLEGLRFDAGENRFSATLLVEDEGSIVTERTISGRVIAMVEIPVLTRSVPNGSAIGPNDLTAISMSADSIAPNVMTEAADLVGMMADRSLRAGKPILQHEVSEPLMVERGKPVTMQFRFGTLIITARGKALDDAARGEIVRVLNVDSNRTIEAVATAPDTVEPLSTAAQTAALGN